MPSKPLFGIPVVVGMSDAVIAMRSICSLLAGERSSSDPANASAQHERRVVMAFSHLVAQVGPPLLARPGEVGPARRADGSSGSLVWRGLFGQPSLVRIDPQTGLARKRHSDDALCGDDDSVGKIKAKEVPISWHTGSGKGSKPRGGWQEGRGVE
jgi:hypothetical protein